MYKFDNKSMTPEVKMDMKKFPEHLYNWLYDFDNPIQKKVFPVRTILEMYKEIEKLKDLIRKKQ